MGFDNDKKAQTEMLSYLKLHRLHSTNIVCINEIIFHLNYFFNFYYLGKNVKIPTQRYCLSM